MGISPRTLRPSSTFTPRSISGLALWLDASSTDSLYTTDAGPVVPVNDPLDIATPALWLDGADSSAASMTLDGTAVSSWRDKSGNGRDFTASGTARPTLTASGLNGKSVVTFDGSNDQLTNATNVVGFSSVTMFAVVYRQSGVYGGIISSTSDADSSPSLVIENTNIATRGHLNISQSTGGFTGPAVVCGRVNAGATQIFTDGLVRDSDAVSGSLGSVTTTAIGTYRLSAATYLNGYIAEIIVYPTALTTAQRASVEAYLAAKWSISGVHAPATASSDPVGYWADRSGNGRHAVQATAGLRPSYITNSLNGKPALTGGGGASVRGMVVPAFQFYNAHTAMFVFRAGGVNQTVFNRGSLTNDRPKFDTSGSPLLVNARKGGANAGQVSSAIAYTASQWSVGGLLSDVATLRCYLNGIYGTDQTGNTESWSDTAILRLFSLTDTLLALNGGIAEFLYYDRQLTAPEVSRLAAYLSRKYGITLNVIPTVANADAQDWINRVYQNGGSVSSATAQAVNQFCVDLENAPGGSIRDRFFRLNLFCGSFQGAFVPLFRGPSLGGSPLGNATDNNLGSPAFLVGDYSETGVNAGLNGNGTSKYLDTGLNLSQLPSIATGHLSILKGAGGTFGVVPIGVRNAASDQYFRYDQTGPSGNNRGLWGNVIIANAASNTSRLYAIASRTDSTTLTVYHDGVSAGTSSTPATPALPGRNLFVFAENNGSAGSFWPHALQAYSVGLSLDAGQALALSNAMATFQASLVRS